MRKVTARRKPARRPAAKRSPARKATPKKKVVSPIPAGFTTLTAHLVIRNAPKAIEWYKKALGAKLKKIHLMPDGKVMYAMLVIGDTPFQLNDEFDMMEHWKSPSSFNGTTVGVHIYTKDVDALFSRAVNAGARPLFPVSDTFWGDRYGSFIDPFGHAWSVATHKQDLTNRQVIEGAKAFFAMIAAQHGGGGGGGSIEKEDRAPRKKDEEE